MKKLQAWIARSQDGSLWLYIHRPYKTETDWIVNDDDGVITWLELCDTDTNYPNVKWEDEYPTEIELVVNIK